VEIIDDDGLAENQRNKLYTQPGKSREVRVETFKAKRGKKCRIPPHEPAPDARKKGTAVAAKSDRIEPKVNEKTLRRGCAKRGKTGS